MPRTPHLILCFFLLLLTDKGFARDPASLAARQGQALIDSLLQELPQAKEDTDKVNLLNDLSEQCRQLSNYDTALYYAEKAKTLAESLSFKKGIANACNNIGIVYYAQGNYPKTLKNHFAALKINKETGDKKGIADSYHNIGNVYLLQGNYIEALKNFLTSLKIDEDIGDREGMATTYEAIGNMYVRQDNYPEALKNIFAALKIKKALGDKRSMASSYNAIGIAYSEQGKHSEALKNYFASLEISKELNDKRGVAAVYNNIGLVYYRQGNFAEALQSYFISLKSTEEIGTKLLKATLCNNIGDAYTGLHRAKEGKKWLLKGLALSREIGAKFYIRNSYNGLSTTDSALGNYKGAYENYKMYVLYRDSIFNEEDTKKLTQAGMQYDFDKKEAAAKAGQEKKDALAQKELQRQKLVRNGFMGGFVVVLLFAGIFLRQRNNTKKQRERAERSERFKQQFLANMSHEIRTPMNAIMGMTNLTLETPLNTKQRNYLNGVRKSSENLLHIINDILDLSKIEAGKMELEQIDFSLRDIVEQVRQTLQHQAVKKGIELIATVEAKVPDVLIGDPVRLSQVLMNLAGNAVKFTEKGSVQLTVNMDNVQHLIFSVIDTGIGIPADKIDTVFESFSQAHSSDTRKYGGTGLGLTISRQLVGLMGGRIGIESQWGSGSTFSFSINMQQGSAEKLQKQNEEIDGSILNGLRILLADDNEYNRIVCRDTLESKARVQITEAVNGQEVLDKLDQQDFDLVLMDVQMPVMDGFEATRQIRNGDRLKKDIPIIALTASVIRSDLDKCRAAGMNDYVPKPFKPSELFSAIARLTGRELRFIAQSQFIVATHQGSTAPASQYTDLTYLKKFCEGNELKMQKYIGIFLASVPVLTDKLKAALASSDFTEIASQVHGFKTKLVMMGMEEAGALAVRLETDCRTAAPAQAEVSEDTTALIRIVSVAAEELKQLQRLI